VRHLIEERFDFPMLMFQKIEGIHRWLPPRLGYTQLMTARCG